MIMMQMIIDDPVPYDDADYFDYCCKLYPAEAYDDGEWDELRAIAASEFAAEADDPFWQQLADMLPL